MPGSFARSSRLEFLNASLTLAFWVCLSSWLARWSMLFFRCNSWRVMLMSFSKFLAWLYDRCFKMFFSIKCKVRFSLNKWCTWLSMNSCLLGFRIPLVLNLECCLTRNPIDDWDWLRALTLLTPIPCFESSYFWPMLSILDSKAFSLGELRF